MDASGLAGFMLCVGPVVGWITMKWFVRQPKLLEKSLLYFCGAATIALLVQSIAYLLFYTCIVIDLYGICIRGLGDEVWTLNNSIDRCLVANVMGGLAALAWYARWLFFSKQRARRRKLRNAIAEIEYDYARLPGIENLEVDTD